MKNIAHEESLNPFELSEAINKRAKEILGDNKPDDSLIFSSSFLDNLTFDPSSRLDVMAVACLQGIFGNEEGEIFDASSPAAMFTASLASKMYESGKKSS